MVAALLQMQLGDWGDWSLKTLDLLIYANIWYSHTQCGCLNKFIFLQLVSFFSNKMMYLEMCMIKG